MKARIDFRKETKQFSSALVATAASLCILAGAACSDDAGEMSDSDAGMVVYDAAIPSPDADTSQCVTPTGQAADLQLAGGCPSESLLGLLSLEISDFSSFDAKVGNAVNPLSVRSEVMSMGDCRLMKPVAAFCDPFCIAGELCSPVEGGDGVCVAESVRQDLGDMCVGGLAEPFVLTAEAPEFHYLNTMLPAMAFSGGERIELSTTGGDYPAMELAGVGVSKMVSINDTWNVEDGADLDIAWTTSTADVLANVFLTLNIDQHGTSRLILECEFPDTGSAVVPSELITILTSFGVSGFPKGLIQRRTQDSVMVDQGCIEFTVRSSLAVDVLVAGHTPCTINTICPKGQNCNLMLETCQ